MFHPASSTNCCVPLTDHHVCHATLRLLQQCIVCFACVPDQASPVYTECHCVAHIRYLALLHIPPVLISLHWLRVPERISFKLSVLTYRAIRGPRYLQSCFTHVSDMQSRRRLRSSCSDRLQMPLVRLSTISSRTFLASDATVWNDLPTRVRSAPSLVIFRQCLKTFLFLS